MTMYRSMALLLTIAWPALALGQGGDFTQIKERELELVRQQISALKVSLDRRAADRDRITVALQRTEMQVSEKRIHLRELKGQQQFSERKKLQIEARLKTQEVLLANESQQLAAQVKVAYMSGRQERIKLLLNQHDPARLGRLLTYYRYFSAFRGRNIAAVTTVIEVLDQLRQQAAAEEQRLAGLARARYAELGELNTTQENRRELLITLRAKIAAEGSEVQRLAAQEQDLSRLIVELRSILSDYPISSEEPFSKLKGRLTWPIAGRLTHAFGQPRAGGGLKWNGVVLSAPRGREVRAIYHGRVIFADWLAGTGLLVIVDHGDGYMSLYGYNETTLKTTGDWVAPGDVIATVGESGGQALPALYFELRKGTKPIDPGAWFSRQPKTGKVGPLTTNPG